MVYDPESGKMISEYEVNMKNRVARDAADKSVNAGPGITDESGAIPESAKKIDWTGESNLTQNAGFEDEIAGAKGQSGVMAGTQAAGQAINTAASGGSAIDVAGGGLTSAGMYSANPYLVGAGLGLSALSATQKGKQQREQNRYLAEVQKYEQRQNAYNKLAQLGQGLKA